MVPSPGENFALGKGGRAWPPTAAWLWAADFGCARFRKDFKALVYLYLNPPLNRRIYRPVGPPSGDRGG
jgi:hypothetical protein